MDSRAVGKKDSAVFFEAQWAEVEGLRIFGLGLSIEPVKVKLVALVFQRLGILSTTLKE